MLVLQESAVKVVQSVRLPLRLRSFANLRLHWRKKASIIKEHRLTAYLMTKREDVPVTVRITRCGPRKMDRDNNISAMKGVIDGIADRLKVDDGDERINWEYGQQVAQGYSVLVEFIQDEPA